VAPQHTYAPYCCEASYGTRNWQRKPLICSAIIQKT